MANNIGATLIVAPIRPQSSEDTFPSSYANEALGGHHCVTTITERNAISTARRVEGMTCYVAEDEKTYSLINGILNANWKESLSRIESIGQQINFVKAKGYVVDFSAVTNYTITALTAELNQGTLTATLQINNVTVGVLNCTSTKQRITFSASNIVVPEDTVYLIVSNVVGSPSILFNVEVLVN